MNDQELIDYVQLIAGLGAIGRVFLEAVIICSGFGRNGKSTLWNAIKRVMGTYAGTVSADVLTANCRRNIKPELADLRGKDPFEFIPSHTTVLLTNYHLDTPQAVECATWQYKDDVRAGEFLTAYNDYCTRTGEANKKPVVINDALEAAGYERQESRKDVIIKGLRLR